MIYIYFFFIIVCALLYVILPFEYEAYRYIISFFFFLFIVLSIHEKRSILLFIFPKEKRGLAADPATIIYLKHIIYLCMRFFLPAVYMSSYTRIGCSLIWRTACCTGFKSSAAVLVAKHYPFRQERTAVSYPLL